MCLWQVECSVCRKCEVMSVLTYCQSSPRITYVGQNWGQIRNVFSDCSRTSIKLKILLCIPPPVRHDGGLPKSQSPHVRCDTDFHPDIIIIMVRCDTPSSSTHSSWLSIAELMDLWLDYTYEYDGRLFLLPSPDYQYWYTCGLEFSCYLVSVRLSVQWMLRPKGDHH